MKLEIELNREVLEDIFVTAIEGGSNYWYFLSKDAIKRIRQAVPREVDAVLSTATLKAVYDHGVAVPINDVENEEDIVGWISMETMQERLQDLYNNKDLRWALEAHIERDGDADSADVVFQYLAMGEVVYG
jgi:hypothetical protein